jgi:hypothetical protein
MPRLTLSTDVSGEVHVSKAKRRIRSTTAFLDETREEKKATLLKVKKWKVYKNRAIQSARDFKHADDGRGEEAFVDMTYETTNSRLSSREAKPFIMTHTSNWPYTLHHGECLRNTNPTVKVRGTLYKAYKQKDIIMIHELNGKPVRLMMEYDFVIAEMELHQHLCLPGQINTVFW